ncbi:RDD family protein [Halalkalibacter kiskunsagensis]|uniref:RDD family protein n=1 Tax=Halalkalibacter kiskunsagensis TaxID=1548599 RepID=A0ABV6KIU5_9BACI
MNQIFERHSTPLKRRRLVNERLRNRIQVERPKKDQTQLDKKEDLHFAGFWMRFWAYLLDMIVVFSVNGLLLYPLFKLTNINELHSVGFFRLETVLTALVFFLYFAIMTKIYGQTIGKMVMGLRVMSATKDQLNWSQILFREGIGRFLQQAFFFLYAIYVIIAFTNNKQGLHDKLADTYVIFERNS